MTNEVFAYVVQCRAKGIPDETIRQRLMSTGWSEQIVNEAMQMPTPPIAASPAAEATVAAVSMQAVRGPRAVSPYSEFLAIALALALFVLSNGIFTDIRESVGDTNTILIYEGLFAIPFLVLGLLFYNSFTDRKRYKVLAQPYFVVSTWILIRLLWKVGAYILDKNAAVGVYIVLAMVIVVLTVVVVFAQKIIHK